ncbi:hypothetical protein KAJ41_00370 [Candidatus Parcubacteria bacterium]|nr:hypothetical protein [Candidatus Parcubacteria bacterium]
MRELLGQELLTDEKKQNLVNIGEIWIKNRSKLTRREIVNNELKIKYLKKLQKLKCWKYYLKTETSTFDLKNQIPLASVSA